MYHAITEAPAELVHVVESVFQAILRIEVQPSLDVPPASGEMVTASVHLTGKFQGAVLLHCPSWHACQLAGTFYKKSPPNEVDDDVLDLMGELANMVTGNLKSTLLPGTKLSMPSVTQGPDSALRLCGSHPVQRAAFRTPMGPIWVTLFTSQSQN